MLKESAPKATRNLHMYNTFISLKTPSRETTGLGLGKPGSSQLGNRR